MTSAVFETSPRHWPSGQVCYEQNVAYNKSYQTWPIMMRAKPTLSLQQPKRHSECIFGLIRYWWCFWSCVHLNPEHAHILTFVGWQRATQVVDLSRLNVMSYHYVVAASSSYKTLNKLVSVSPTKNGEEPHYQSRIRDQLSNAFTEAISLLHSDHKCGQGCQVTWIVTTAQPLEPTAWHRDQQAIVTAKGKNPQPKNIFFDRHDECNSNLCQSQSYMCHA